MDDLFGGLLGAILEGVGDFLLEMLGAASETPAGGGEVAGNQGPVERYKFLPDDAEG